jgi:hypothetical protein
MDKVAEKLDTIASSTKFRFSTAPFCECDWNTEPSAAILMEMTFELQLWLFSASNGVRMRFLVLRSRQNVRIECIKQEFLSVIIMLYLLLGVHVLYYICMSFVTGTRR